MSRTQQNHKVVCSQGPGTIASSATSASTIDTLGYDYAVVDVMLNPATGATSSAKLDTLQLEHGSTTDPTNHTAINGAIGTTNATASATQFVLPVHNDTSFASIVRFFVNLADKQRILRIEKTGCASHSTTVDIAHLSNADEVPDTATLRGVNAQVFV